MKRFHIALAVPDLQASIDDYSKRLGAELISMVEGEYALWRTQTLNFSLKQATDAESVVLRHLGWEDQEATAFSAETDCNGLVWERFSFEQQVSEIKALWPEKDS